MIQSKFFKTSLVLSALTLSLASCDKESIIPATELPNDIQNYLSTHFPNKNVVQVLEDLDGFTKTYDILLEGNISLEFNRKKEVISIDSNTALPSSVIPERIRQYVATNYPNNVITDWELDDRNQQVELDNGLDLEFNRDGEFLRIDS